MVALADRPALRRGDVIACRGAGAIDWLIDHATGSDYSHVAVVIETGSAPSVLQAMGTGAARGVAIAPLASLMAADAVDWLETGVIWGDDLDRFARSFVGRPYSYLADIAAALDLSTAGHAEICSTLVAQIMRAAGIPMSRAGMTPGRAVNDLLISGAVLRRLTAK